MIQHVISRGAAAAVLLVASIVTACSQSGSSSGLEEHMDGHDVAVPGASAVFTATEQCCSDHVPAAGAPDTISSPAVATARATAARTEAVAFTGSRAETERFIAYYQTIGLTPDQERIKVAALSVIPAPCCADNSLATCCCPCNMAKAVWGMSAWLITERSYGVEALRQAARDWLAAANPAGFTGNACYSGGCGRAISQNGCGGMDERRVL